MKKLAAVMFSAGLVAGAMQVASAADPAAGPSNATPKCAAGDHVVQVDTKTKTYTMAAVNPGQAGSAGESASAATNTDKGGAARDASGSKGEGSAASTNASDYTSMCKSKADAMGAKMMSKSGSLLNSKVGTGGSH